MRHVKVKFLFIESFEPILFYFSSKIDNLMAFFYLIMLCVFNFFKLLLTFINKKFINLFMYETDTHFRLYEFL